MRDYEQFLSVLKYRGSLFKIPENCLIISTKEQGKNRSNNHKITYNGKTMNLQDWANEVGIAASTIRKRLKSGWTVENALYTSVEKKHKK